MLPFVPAPDDEARSCHDEAIAYVFDWFCRCLALFLSCVIHFPLLTFDLGELFRWLDWRPSAPLDAARDRDSTTVFAVLDDDVVVWFLGVFN